MPFPNFITPKCIPIYIIYQVIMSLVLYIIPIFVMISSRIVYDATGSRPLFLSLLCIGYVLLIAVLLLILFGPANKHTANDNTSGVTTLLNIMTSLPAETRENVAFIFFDLEEMGLFGSAGYANQHKRISQNTLLLNFDCVSDGHTLLFALRKGSARYASTIREAFPASDTHAVEVVSKGVFYPSDQMNFARGVGVAALKSKGSLLYMDRIHTGRDTVYMEENIAYLTVGAVRLAESLTRGNP
jgi:hypothetical protein